MHQNFVEGIRQAQFQVPADDADMGRRDVEAERASTNTVAIYRPVVYSRLLSCAKLGNPAVNYRSRRK